jgi:hypothetical protein
MEGPHRMPLLLGVEKPIKLAEFLRKKGFVKRGK